MDALAYMAFESLVFDLDAVLAKQRVTISACEFVRTLPQNPYAPARGRLKSNKLGACLFENAWQSLGTAATVGYVKASLWLPYDNKSKPAREVFLSWRPLQTFSAPQSLKQMIFVLPEYWQHLATNMRILTQLKRHFADNEIVMWSRQAVPLQSWIGDSPAGFLLSSNGQPEVSQVRFKMWGMPAGSEHNLSGYLKVYTKEAGSQKLALSTTLAADVTPFSGKPATVTLSGESR